MAAARFAAVAGIALISRLFVVTLQVLFNVVIPDHDADAFISPGHEDRTTLDSVVTFLLGGFKKWDSQYFLHIAHYGYTYENTLAFFPFYPIIIHCLATILHFVFGSFASFHTLLLVAGVWTNFILFVISSACLYKLSCLVLGTEKEAFLAALLFCINPASIFFSACYSETLFSALTFSGLLCLETKWKFLASVLFGLSGLTRSNGLINGGFLIYSHFQEMLNMCGSCKNVGQILRQNLLFCFNFFIFLCPFLAFQMYASMTYCMPYQSTVSTVPHEIYELAKEKGYRMVSNNPPPWCNQLLPLSYAYVQRTYWNVGFLRYFEVRQIPNFLLAVPLLVLVGSKCFAYLKILSFNNIFNVILQDRKFPYFVHATALLTFCTFCIHVQVVTRLFASSSPNLYWIAASRILPDWTAAVEKVKFKHEETKLIYYFTCLKVLFRDFLFSKLIIIYFIAFTIVGTLFHVNFLPWT